MVGEAMNRDKSQIKRRLPASERRKVILDAAMRTFVEFGYHGALMDTIAERADVTKPILYRHFTSKLDLLLAILDRAGDDLRNSLAEPVAEEADWRTSIVLNVRSYLDFVERSGVAYRLIYTTDLNVDNRVSERINQIRHGIIDVVAESINFYTDTAAVPPENIGITAVMLVGMVETTAIHWMNSEKIPREVYEDNLVRGITSILAKLPPRKR